MTLLDLPTDAPTPRLSVVLTGLSAAVLAVCLAAGVVDTRLLDGVPVWAKPNKFAASFVVLFATIAWLETRLSPDWRNGWILSTTISVMGVCMVAEMGYIMFQAGRAEASHFNLSTPFNEFMYTVVMFLGALALIFAIAAYGFAAARDKDADLTPGLRWGVVLGFGLSCLLTFVVAGYLGGNGSHFVGTPSPEAATLPLVGWSAEVGDLRPAHFLSLHAMQALPLLGWFLDRRWPKSARTGTALGATAYTAATLGIFAQALAGYPLIALS